MTDGPEDRPQWFQSTVAAIGEVNGMVRSMTPLMDTLRDASDDAWESNINAHTDIEALRGASDLFGRMAVELQSMLDTFLQGAEAGAYD